MTPPSSRSLASGLVALMTAGALLLTATPAFAEDITPTRLSAARVAEEAPSLTESAPAEQPELARAAETYSNALVGGEELAGGESIVSTDDTYTFVMQTDGNAVTYDANGRPVWSTGTQGRGDHLAVQTDGNLVIYSADDRPVWNTGTGTEQGAVVVIQNDGNLVIYRENNSPAWASSVGGKIAEPAIDTLFAGQTLRVGHQLTSADGRFKAVMQTDGNFVGYGPNGVVWNTGTRGSGNRLVLQEDGNAVIYGPDDSVKWFSGTSGSDLRLGVTNVGSLIIVEQDDTVVWTSQAQLPSSTLWAANGLEVGSLLRSANGVYRAVMQSDGNFVVYGGTGPIWSTGTSGAGNSFNIYDDGFLAVVSSDGYGKWTATARSGATGPFRLVLQDDGNLVEYDGQNRASWSSR